MIQIIIFFFGIFLNTVTKAYASPFFDPLYNSYYLNEGLSLVGQIDDSHNQKHGKEVLFWAQQIIQKNDMKFHRNDLLLIGQCCLLHDLVDHKYTDFTEEVQTHLERYHRIHEVEMMMNVMKTMSYSKTVNDQHALILPGWLDESPYQHVFHITREADLLSSYNVARMVEYRKTKYPNLSENEGIQECINLYETRMAKMSPDLFWYKGTQELARSLDTVAQLKLKLLPNIYSYPNLDILRIVNHLSIYDLVQQMEQLPCQYMS